MPSNHHVAVQPRPTACNIAVVVAGDDKSVAVVNRQAGLTTEGKWGATSSVVGAAAAEVVGPNLSSNRLANRLPADHRVSCQLWRCQWIRLEQF